MNVQEHLRVKRLNSFERTGLLCCLGWNQFLRMWCNSSPHLNVLQECPEFLPENMDKISVGGEGLKIYILYSRKCVRVHWP